MEQVVIIGNGISGVTAARHIRKLSDKKITIISAETPYFFSRTALMYVYMGHLKWEHTQPYENWFWDKNNIQLVQDLVTKIDTNNKTLYLKKASPIKYNKLILATGSKPTFYNWPGQNANGVQGLYSKQDLINLEHYAPNNKTCKHAVIVGGGLIGIELAEMLHSRNIPVTFLVRETSFWNGVLPDPESNMINQHIQAHGINLLLNSSLKEIKKDQNNKVTAIIVKETLEEIPCNFVGITTGVTPNIEFIRDTNIKTNKGILVNNYLQTNLPDIYAIGDCAELQNPPSNRKPIEAIWYTGKKMGETLAHTICNKPTKYQPGHWFNSAKFFDMEYQTYGQIHGKTGKPASEAQVHWKHPQKNICITIAYHKTTYLFLGINAFGIRMRHDVFNQWLNEKRDVSYVIKHLHKANFDPEFFNRYENEIQATLQPLIAQSHV